MQKYIIFFSILLVIACYDLNQKLISKMFVNYSSNNYPKKQSVSLDTNFILIQKMNCKVEKIPQSGLLLQDYCKIYNISINRGSSNISYNDLVGWIFNFDEYRIYLDFYSQDRIPNFYLLEEPDTLAILKFKISNTRIYHQKYFPATKFLIDKDTLFLK